jgi:hypothetical protein
MCDAGDFLQSFSRLSGCNPAGSAGVTYANTPTLNVSIGQVVNRATEPRQVLAYHTQCFPSLSGVPVSNNGIEATPYSCFYHVKPFSRRASCRAFSHYFAIIS